MNSSRTDFAAQNKQATNSGRGLSKQDILQPRLRVITGVDNFPTPSVQSTTVPVRENFNQADNRYRESRSVDSRSQAKSSSKAAAADQGLPQYFGSTFTHVPNAPNRPLLIPPKSPAYAAPYSPLAKQEFAASPLQNQRSADGSIIGSPSKRFVHEHVSFRLQIRHSLSVSALVRSN